MTCGPIRPSSATTTGTGRGGPSAARTRTASPSSQGWLPPFLPSSLFFPPVLQLHFEQLAVVAHAGVRLRVERKAHRLVLADQHDLEGALLLHALERALALADGQRPRGVVPAQRDAREGALFVGVGQAVVL